MPGSLCKEGSKIQMMAAWWSWLDEEVAKQAVHKELRKHKVMPHVP